MNAGKSAKATELSELIDVSDEIINPIIKLGIIKNIEEKNQNLLVLMALLFTLTSS